MSITNYAPWRADQRDLMPCLPACRGSFSDCGAALGTQASTPLDLARFLVVLTSSRFSFQSASFHKFAEPTNRFLNRFAVTDTHRNHQISLSYSALHVNPPTRRAGVRRNRRWSVSDSSLASEWCTERKRQRLMCWVLPLASVRRGCRYHIVSSTNQPRRGVIFGIPSAWHWLFLSVVVLCDGQQRGFRHGC